LGSVNSNAQDAVSDWPLRLPEINVKCVVVEEVRVPFDEVGNEGIWRYGISARLANEDPMGP